MHVTVKEYLKVIVIKLDDFCSSEITSEKNFKSNELDEARNYARMNSKDREVAFIARVS